MQMAILDFNASEVKPNEGRGEPIPAGRYAAMISASEMKPTKDGTDSYLHLEFTLLEGEHKNRKVFARLCMNHPNAQTVTIARGDLSAICHAVGVLQPRDSLELHNLPLLITVAVVPRTDAGHEKDMHNEIRKYESKAAVAASQAPQQEQTRTAEAPWK